MVWHVNKHLHKDILGTFDSVVECLEAFWKRLNAFRAFSERMGTFSGLGRLGSIVPCGVWYGMYLSRHKQKETSGAFWNSLERFGAV